MVDGSEPVQLTRGKEPVGEYEWSADGQWLAFMHDKKLSLIRADGGEPISVNLEIEGISRLRFAPDNSALYFIGGPEDKSLIKAREECHGSYTVVREDGGFEYIWRLPLNEGMKPGDKAEQLTTGREYSVVDFAVLPDGEHLAFATWPTPHLADLLQGRMYMMAVAGGDVMLVDDSHGGKAGIKWHPDNEHFAYTNLTGFPEYSDIVVNSVDSTNVQKFDMSTYDPEMVRFANRTIEFAAGVRMELHLYRLKTGSGEISLV